MSFLSLLTQSSIKGGGGISTLFLCPPRTVNLTVGGGMKLLLEFLYFPVFIHITSHLFSFSTPFFSFQGFTADRSDAGRPSEEDSR